LDLSCWELAFTGAEPIRGNTLRPLRRGVLANAGSGPKRSILVTGLAEATLFVTGAERGKPPTIRLLDRDRIGRGEVAETNSMSSVELVASGRPGAGVQVRIVDPETHEACPPDRVGEIWVAWGERGPRLWGYTGDEQTSGAPSGHEESLYFLSHWRFGFPRNAAVRRLAASRTWSSMAPTIIRRTLKR